MLHLVVLLLLFETSIAIKNDPTIMEVKGLGFLKGKSMKTMGFKGSQPKTYHSYRGIKYATNYTKEHRFKESMKYDEILGSSTNPADKSKDGPICQQGSLNEKLFASAEIFTIDFALLVVLEKLNVTGRIPEPWKDALPDINAPFIISILEEVFGQDLKGKTLDKILEDWLDITVQVSEECLNLNVAKPGYANKTSNLPVMFYIYGGGYTGGIQLKSFPERLGDAEDIVFVSANYRVGQLGFMCMDNEEAAGNMGLLDIVIALEWVQKYIRNFGGDPNRVTIYGESAGSASVSHLILSPYLRDMEKPLFHQAIGSSGSALSPWAFAKESEYHADKFIDELLHCKGEDIKATFDCLRNDSMEARTISKATKTYVKMQRSQGEMGFAGVIPCAQKKGKTKLYGQFDDPAEIAKSGNYRKIPVLFGANSHEGTYVYDMVYSSYLDKNNLTDNKDFLVNGFMSKMLSSVHVSQSDFMAEMLQDEFFMPDHIGNLSLMTPGAIDMLGALYLKASAYEFVQLNSKYENSYWYSLEQKSRKSFAHLSYGNLKPLPLGTLPSPGVAHADDLWHIFNYQVPLVWCDLRPILGSLVVRTAICVFQNASGHDVDYPSCIADPKEGGFMATSGECLDGSLTLEDQLTSYNMVNAFASFVKNGKPSISQDDGNVFDIQPWTHRNPVYMQFASDGVHKKTDFTKTYHTAVHEAYGDKNNDSTTTRPASSTTASPETSSGTSSVNMSNWCIVALVTLVFKIMNSA